MSFSSCDEFAKDIVRFALDNNFGVVFNHESPTYNLIKEGGMIEYFSITDSFFCPNSEFMFNTDWSDFGSYRNRFFEKFSFLEGIMKIIFSYNISVVELYVSVGMGMDDDLDNFDAIETTPSKFLSDIFDNILKYKDEMAYQIPNLRLIFRRLDNS